MDVQGEGEMREYTNPLMEGVGEARWFNSTKTDNRLTIRSCKERDGCWGGSILVEIFCYEFYSAII